ncbi:MAG: hypothetical protein CMB31_04570 [Euryarchaeota archaeon]|nr:hypothetical protein [Euryarchaeota archaeon]|tara:strand:- start:233 stop:625 length:393 start_codon:yes stop_codon:yes gene_type:complete
MKLGTERDVLLLDGDCGLCHRLAIFIDKRKHSDADIAFRPIESEEGQDLISSFSEKQQRADTVYIIRNGKTYIRSGAGIRVLLYMKWYWRMWYPLVWLVPLPIRDIVYMIIAKNRHRIFERPNVCSFRID